MKNNSHIFLCGFMGSGKTTVGKLLADLLGCRFIDTDREIEIRESRSIRDIFSVSGEAHFRELERAVIFALQGSGGKTVAALGGGSLLDPTTLEWVLQNGALVYLKADPETLMGRTANDPTRPLLQTHAFEELFERRRPGYERAQFTVDTGTLPAARAAEKIAALLAQHADE